jgi:hypothetical protein
MGLEVAAVQLTSVSLDVVFKVGVDKAPIPM